MDSGFVMPRSIIIFFKLFHLFLWTASTMDSGTSVFSTIHKTPVLFSVVYFETLAF